jgi:hypothetical protein
MAATNNLIKVLLELGLDVDKLPKEITESGRSGDLMTALLAQEIRGLKENNKESHAVLFKKIDCFEAKFNDREGKKGIFTRLGIVESSVTKLWYYYGALAGTILLAATYIIRDHLVLLG